MEWQKEVYEFLVVLTIILILATVVYPLSVLAAQSAGQRLSRLRAPGVRNALQKLSRIPLFETRPQAEWRPWARAAGPVRNVRDRRHQPRVAICFGGILHTGRPEKGAKACDILDLSAGGARVRLTDPVGRISRITLRLGDFGAFRARVVWRNADELGLRFEAEAQTVIARMRGLLPSTAAA